MEQDLLLNLFNDPNLLACPGVNKGKITDMIHYTHLRQFAVKWNGMETQSSEQDGCPEAEPNRDS